ncbi:MAG: enoyl-CoA hydratase/isomerase family protein [Planctomycetes bacterium]|nr:enoyl-CoA hydratase/isomerase family protein [Planctomycetota bacterium]
MNAIQQLKTAKVRTAILEGGAVCHVTLDSPKGNILDAAMTAELNQIFEEAAKIPELKAVLLTAEGKHYCFGASVEEHQPDQVAGMLAGFHRLFRTMAASGLPVITAVRGCCLGGGLELAGFCQRIFAHPESSFGQPEIVLGVIAPVGSAILADRVGRGAADDLLLTGRTIKADEAHAMRLVDQISEDPETAALDWIREHLLPRSASTLRLATRAARHDFQRRFERDVEELETYYLETLMATDDAKEGIMAFLEKRKPNWSDR